MRYIALDDAGWTAQPKTNLFTERWGEDASVRVVLPHDNVITTERSPSGDPATAYFPGGVFEYKTTLDITKEDRGGCISLLFEGVYRDASVIINDAVAGHCFGGYTEFVVPIDEHLTADGLTAVKVEARAHTDSRWYTGAGIHRRAWLLLGRRIHIEPRGVQIKTVELTEDVAVLAVETTLSNHDIHSATSKLRVEILDDGGDTLELVEAPVSTTPGDTLTVRQRVALRRPHRWDPDDPYLHRCRVSIYDSDQALLDEESTTFGIRSLLLDPECGLVINGKTVLLRGACVHHDNGLLGAATIDRADERRVELLKAAGFNAIRSAHNPMSTPMLDACDRLGILVMDEAFDMWQQPKSDFDHSQVFLQAWEGDVEAMVRRDFNHPSVIMYSIGNEIPDVGRPQGARLGRRIAEKVRSLDDTRFVTAAVSGLLAGGDEFMAELRAEMAKRMDASDPDKLEATGVNTTMTEITDYIDSLMTGASVTERTAEVFSYVDIAGYNYMEQRFEMDAKLYPQRMIVASETHPKAIGTGWLGVEEQPRVIGDFTWTGWDYLGEVGVGRTEYDMEGPPSFHGQYPWLTAWVGDVDICGNRRPQSYYREIVYGLRSDPYIAVERPEHYGHPRRGTPWTWADVISSWSWTDYQGKPVVVEVYADADEVELQINGRAVGRQPVGNGLRFRTEFETNYEPGVIEAVAFKDGEESGRTRLESASGEVLLAAQADRSTIVAQPGDLAFVELALVDDAGVVHADASRTIEVEVEGPAVLAALGSANPRTAEDFHGSSCSTFDGRALAIVRPTGPGQIDVKAAIVGGRTQSVTIEAVRPTDSKG
jgi:beta-galactosidase